MKTIINIAEAYEQEKTKMERFIKESGLTDTQLQVLKCIAFAHSGFNSCNDDTVSRNLESMKLNAIKDYLKLEGYNFTYSHVEVESLLILIERVKLYKEQYIICENDGIDCYLLTDGYVDNNIGEQGVTRYIYNTDDDYFKLYNNVATGYVCTDVDIKEIKHVFKDDKDVMNLIESNEK